MKRKTALWIIFCISIAGILFSGSLAYFEITARTCPVGGCVYVLGLPSCIYGFIMYAVVLVISILGIRSKK